MERDYYDDPLSPEEVTQYKNRCLRALDEGKRPTDSDLQALRESIPVVGPVVTRAEKSIIASIFERVDVYDQQFQSETGPDSKLALEATNAIPILLSSEVVLSTLDKFSEEVERSNSLEEEARVRLSSAMNEIRLIVSEISELVVSEERPEVDDGWFRRYKHALVVECAVLSEPQHIASVTVPTAAILGFGAIGSLVAGPLGFGLGSVAGHLISGHMKPGQAARKLEELWDSSD